MMIETGVVTLALFTWLFFRAANRSTEKQELLDLAQRARGAAGGVAGAPRGRRGPGRAAAPADPQRRRRPRGTGQRVSGNRFLYALVFVVGVASLGAEIAAVRLMAPFFGASTIVWANTIGVVLVALSIGYWLGGRLGDRHPQARGALRDDPDRRRRCWRSCRSSPSPSSTSPSMRSTRSRPAPSSARCSGVLFLLAVPIVLLGTCSPWAIRLAVTDVEHRRHGRRAASTRSRPRARCWARCSRPWCWSRSPGPSAPS